VQRRNLQKAKSGRDSDELESGRRQGKRILDQPKNHVELEVRGTSEVELSSTPGRYKLAGAFV
jgi:hypothetical protein